MISTGLAVVTGGGAGRVKSNGRNILDGRHSQFLLRGLRDTVYNDVKGNILFRVEVLG